MGLMKLITGMFTDHTPDAEAEQAVRDAADRHATHLGIIYRDQLNKRTQQILYDNQQAFISNDPNVIDAEFEKAPAVAEQKKLPKPQPKLPTARRRKAKS